MGCKTKPIILIIIKDWGKTHSVDTHLFDKTSPDDEELLAAIASPLTTTKSITITVFSLDSKLELCQLR